MKEAFSALSAGNAQVPPRLRLEMAEQGGRALFMPAYSASKATCALKMVTIYDKNPERRLPTIQALLTLFDAETGSPVALMDAESLTTIRTGAASGLATDMLARRDASSVAIFGAGNQAWAQLHAVCTVRDIRQALIFARDLHNAEDFAERARRDFRIRARPATHQLELMDVDVICTATPSTEVLFKDSHMKPGTHINAIGSYRPDMQEIPQETIASAKIFLDDRASCLQEAGEIIQALESGILSEDHLRAELGMLANGRIKGRRNNEEITLFKSVGNAVQDLYAAAAVYKEAEELGLGTVVRL